MLQFSPPSSSPAAFHSIALQLHCNVRGTPARILRAYPVYASPPPTSVNSGVTIDSYGDHITSYVKDEATPYKCYHIFDSSVQVDWQCSIQLSRPPQLVLYLLLAVSGSARVSFNYDMLSKLSFQGSIFQKATRRLHPPKTGIDGEFKLPRPNPLASLPAPIMYKGESRFSMVDFNDATLYRSPVKIAGCSKKPALSDFSGRSRHFTENSIGWMSRHSIGEKDESWGQFNLSSSAHCLHRATQCH